MGANEERIRQHHVKVADARDEHALKLDLSRAAPESFSGPPARQAIMLDSSESFGSPCPSPRTSSRIRDGLSWRMLRLASQYSLVDDRSLKQRGEAEREAESES